eukprot:TRINITY_DN66800_c0_g1_i1.p1 TRINITY_DN66800_c0_g1~~TRINITY_DN66800_c0_g1_i1.p1  ORF type:complete len:877 (-),score=80.35 TRINITY_DN66800_c0_g1_i1:368-2998(-)
MAQSLLLLMLCVVLGGLQLSVATRPNNTPCRATPLPLAPTTVGTSTTKSAWYSVNISTSTPQLLTMTQTGQRTTDLYARIWTSMTSSCSSVRGTEEKLFSDEGFNAVVLPRGSYWLEFSLPYPGRYVTNYVTFTLSPGGSTQLPTNTACKTAKPVTFNNKGISKFDIDMEFAFPPANSTNFRSLWFSFKAPITGRLFLNTTGPVFRDGTLPAITTLYAPTTQELNNNASCMHKSEPRTQSGTLATQKGVTYWLEIGLGAAGSPRGTVIITLLKNLPNMVPCSATQLSLVNGVPSKFALPIGQIPPLTTAACQNTDNPSLWYSWTSPSHGLLSVVSTRSSTSCAVQVSMYKASSVNCSSLAQDSLNACLGSMTTGFGSAVVEANTKYLLGVTTNYQPFNTLPDCGFWLNYTQDASASKPHNTRCPTAQKLTIDPTTNSTGQIYFDASLATVGKGRQLWYTFIAPREGMATADISGAFWSGRGRIILMTPNFTAAGTPCSTASELGTASWYTLVEPGKQYFVNIELYSLEGGGEGSYGSFNVTITTGAENVFACRAKPLNLATAKHHPTVLYTSINRTQIAQESPTPCNTFQPTNASEGKAPQLWYRVEAPGGTQGLLNVYGEVAASVWSGDDCGNLKHVQCLQQSGYNSAVIHGGEVYWVSLMSLRAWHPYVPVKAWLGYKQVPKAPPVPSNTWCKDAQPISIYRNTSGLIMFDLEFAEYQGYPANKQLWYSMKAPFTGVAYLLNTQVVGLYKYNKYPAYKQPCHLAEDPLLNVTKGEVFYAQAFADLANGYPYFDHNAPDGNFTVHITPHCNPEDPPCPSGTHCHNTDNGSKYYDHTNGFVCLPYAKPGQLCDVLPCAPGYYCYDYQGSGTCQHDN